MSDNTAIEWTDATWNPTVGCSVLSPGCANCYAMKLAGRLEAMGSPIYAGHTIKTKAGYVWNGKVSASNWGQVIKPLSWRRPRRIFVNSMSDLFHEDMPVKVIDQVFAVMALCPQHTFQVLTKRADRMRAYFNDRDALGEIAEAVGYLATSLGKSIPSFPGWPLPNVWLGVSVEDGERKSRIDELRQCPARIRFLSCEPLLEDLGSLDLTGIGWVIVGGESGHGARPMHPYWARSIRNQCDSARVPFFFKQWGEYLPNYSVPIAEKARDAVPGTIERVNDRLLLAAIGPRNFIAMSRVGRKGSGRQLDGREHNEFPNAVNG